jgi:hypothetical protein
MTERDFCYWLQGLMEVGNPTTLNEDQVKVIKEHLQLVFKQDPKIKQLMEDLTNGHSTTRPSNINTLTAPTPNGGLIRSGGIYPNEDDIVYC